MAQDDGALVTRWSTGEERVRLLITEDAYVFAVAAPPLKEQLDRIEKKLDAILDAGFYRNDPRTR